MLINKIDFNKIDLDGHTPSPSVAKISRADWLYRGFIYLGRHMFIKDDGAVYVVWNGSLFRTTNYWDNTSILEPAAKAWAKGNAGLTAFEYLSMVFE